MNNNPIGIFDSGVGGTSIWKEIHTLLPYEDTVYLADGKNAPYGEKSVSEILNLSIKNTEFLLEKGCKLIVVACNTATTNAILYLREHYKVPFIGIEPAIKPAALQSKSKKVGVLATKGTLASSLFHSTAANYAEGIQIIEREGTGLVSLIEAGKAQSKEARELLTTFLEPMLDQGIDSLVLGCTHYPYLIPLLQDILPSNIKIIDSGAAVARQTKAVLLAKSLMGRDKTNAEIQFYTNVNTAVLAAFLESSEAKYTVNFQEF